MHCLADNEENYWWELGSERVTSEFIANIIMTGKLQSKGANLHEVILFFIDSSDVFSIIVNHIMEIIVPTVNRTKITCRAFHGE